MTVDEILKSFERYDGIYKRQEVDAAIALQEKITPYLINILKDLLNDPEKHIAEENQLFNHIYAFILLGYFRETGAHDVIVDLFSLPDKLPEFLFGDCTTNNLPMVLLNTCGGDLTRIKELIQNEAANEYCRGSAIESIMYGVIEGIISREDALSYYGDLFRELEKHGESSMTATLACCICDLYPEELMPVIRKAYDDGIIDPICIGLDEFDEVLEQDKNEFLQRLYDKFAGLQSSSVHNPMLWWACFNQEQDMGELSVVDSDKNQSELSSVSGKKSKKSKKKMVKKSKKANRKKKK